MIGWSPLQLWGRRVALLAMAGAAVYIPLILVGAAVMSEPLFALLLLGALAAASSTGARPIAGAGWCSPACSAGLTILTRANAMVLLLPFGLAVWTVRPRFSPRALAAPALLVVLALLTVSPWTIRNAVVIDRFIPVSTQLGSALAGTYNERAASTRRTRPRGARSGTSPSTGPLYARLGEIPEPEVEDELRGALEGLHPRAPDLCRQGRAVDVAADARARRPGLVAPHGVDDQRLRGLGQRRRDLLLGLRAARDRRRVHEARRAGRRCSCG